MTITRCSILFFGLLTACTNKVKQEHVNNSLLLTSAAKEVYSSDELEKLTPQQMHEMMSPNFDRKTDTIKYLKGKIYISCLTTAPGCAQYVSDITLKNDTIRVQLVNKGNVVCTELTAWRVTCEVKNEQNKRFVFQK